MKLRWASVAVLMLMLLLTAAPGQADEKTVTDHQDTASPLDVASVMHSHTTTEAGKDRFVHTIEMHDPWTSSTLRNRPHRGAYIQILFDTRPKSGYDDYSSVTERRIQITYRNGELRAILYNSLGDPPKRLARLNIYRESDTSVSVVVSKRQLKKGELDHYDWGVQTIFTQRGHERCGSKHVCSDQAPDRPRGYIRHDI